MTKKSRLGSDPFKKEPLNWIGKEPKDQDQEQVFTKKKDRFTRNTSNTRIAGKKEKMTFYIERESLQQLRNFAYWDRHSLTDAFNIVLKKGLKNKNTKQIS